MSRESIAPENERGQTMAEYVVVLGVITIAIVGAFSGLAGAMEAAFQRTVDIVSSV